MELFDLGLVYGTRGGPLFNTTVITTGDGRESRRINWALPQYRFKLGDRTLLDWELEELLQFHNSMRGSLTTFLYRDWGDYGAVGQTVGVGDGRSYSWQLTKTYSNGLDTVVRPIAEILNNSETVYLDGVETKDYSITDGRIDFLEPPPSGVQITADFKFVIPVRFTGDELPYTLIGYSEGEKIYRLGQVDIESVRSNLFTSLSSSSTIPPIFDLGVLLDSEFKQIYSTTALSGDGGYDVRYANWDSPHTSIDLAERTWSEPEIAELLNYFYCARGRGMRLYLGDPNFLMLGRFDTDWLDYSFEITDERETVYRLNNLPFRLAPPLDRSVTTSLIAPWSEAMPLYEVQLRVRYRHNYGGQEPGVLYDLSFQFYSCWEYKAFPADRQFWSPEEPWKNYSHSFYGPLKITHSHSGTYCFDSNQPKILITIEHRDGTYYYGGTQSVGRRVWGVRRSDRRQDTYTKSVFLKDPATSTITARTYGAPSRVRVNGGQVELFCYGVVSAAIDSDQYQPWEISSGFNRQKNWISVSRFSAGSAIDEFEIFSVRAI